MVGPGVYALPCDLMFKTRPVDGCLYIWLKDVESRSGVPFGVNTGLCIFQDLFLALFIIMFSIILTFSIYMYANPIRFSREPS